jgi:DNA polymerase-3 subunit delta
VPEDREGQAMIVTLTGNNSFGLRRRLGELTSKFVTEYGQLALERVEAENVDTQAIIEAVQSLPFLAARKMVVLRDLSANKPAAETIEQIISSTGETTELIIYEPNPDKRTSYFKVLKSKTQLEEHNELDAHALASWLTEEARNQGGKLGAADANYLVERIGANQQMLASELTKLLTYATQITRANIELLTEPTPQGKIFELLDSAFGGNKKRALKLYEEQRVQRVEPQAILAMIAWQLQLLALAKYSKDKPAATVAKDTGLNPYPVTKAKNLASKISEDELNKMVDEALDIDWRGKTTTIDLDEALKTYITTL